MIALIIEIWQSTAKHYQFIENFMYPILSRLDPSLFQNIVLGVLAIFIPFAIVFLTDILNSKDDNKSHFERMVLSDEVLGTKRVFWLSIIGIVFFSFFSGVETSTSAKFIAIIIATVLIVLFWKPFQKILRFSEGNKTEFEIPYLKKLHFSSIFRFTNRSKAEKMLSAWDSFWSEKSEKDERVFTKVFISHIDNSIKFRKLDLAVQLAQIYVKNIDKRERFSIGCEILPKVFEWNELLWTKHQRWIQTYDIEKRIQTIFSQKYFPTFSAWTIKIVNKIYSHNDHFWNWHYFGTEFIQEITKTLLQERHDPYELFTALKKHIEEAEKKLEKIAEGKAKEKYRNYITEIFSSFCPVFFNNINNSPSNYEIWEHYFPQEWRVVATNKDNKIARIILHEFLRWSRERIFKKSSNDNFDKNLTEVINGVFPFVHSSLFTAFFMLYYSSDVRQAIEKEPNFYILGESVTWSGSSEESAKERDKRITEMLKENESSQITETIQIILKFFDNWEVLKMFKEDLTKNEFNEWERFSAKQKKLIVKKIRTRKLRKMKRELNSKEIRKICSSSKIKALYCKSILKLIELIISEVNK